MSYKILGTGKINARVVTKGTPQGEHKTLVIDLPVELSQYLDDEEYLIDVNVERLIKEVHHFP